MGNEPPKKQQPKPLDKTRFDIACLKVKAYIEINRDRRINQALTKEKQLSQQILNSSRIRVDEYQKLSALVLDVNFIEACNLVIRCIDVLKQQSIRLCQSCGDRNKIPDLMPYVESVLWSANQLNLVSVTEFKELMTLSFGPSVYDATQYQLVDPELKALFKSPLPDAIQVNNYALKFCEKYGISIEQLNAPGHMFSNSIMSDQPPPQNYGMSNPNFQQQYNQGYMNIDIHIDNPYGQPQQYNVQVPAVKPQGNPYNNIIPNQGNPYGNNLSDVVQQPQLGGGIQPTQQIGFQPAPFPTNSQTANIGFQGNSQGGYQRGSFGQQQQPTSFPQSQGYQQSNDFYQQPGNFPQQPGNFPQQPGNFPQQPGNFPQSSGLGNPLGGGLDLDDLEARYNRLKNQ